MSFTVTVNAQLSSEAVWQATGVVPTGKKVPEAGPQVVVKQPPTRVGAG